MPQLGQLFQNLLSNALKFRRVGVAPLIQVKAGRVAAADLSVLVQPITVLRLPIHWL